MKKNKMKLRGTNDVLVLSAKDDRIIWAMTDEEWASLTPYMRGEIDFKDLRPAVKRYVKMRNIVPNPTGGVVSVVAQGRQGR